MAIISHSSNSKTSKFDDGIANIGATTTKGAIDKLDERLDLLEENGPQIRTEGWKDLTSVMKSSEERDSAPAFIELDNGIGYYHFADGSDGGFNDVDEQYVFITFHIDHDYKVNTEIFPHIHWAPGSTSTGDVLWSFEWVKAKGHCQNESLNVPLIRIDMLQSAKGLEYEHMVVEAAEGDGFFISEPDVIITCKITRRCLDDRDTFVGNVAGVTVDLHYKSEHETTPGKKPDFNIA